MLLPQDGPCEVTVASVFAVVLVDVAIEAVVVVGVMMVGSKVLAECLCR